MPLTDTRVRTGYVERAIVPSLAETTEKRESTDGYVRGVTKSPMTRLTHARLHVSRVARRRNNRSRMPSKCAKGLAYGTSSKEHIVKLITRLLSVFFLLGFAAQAAAQSGTFQN